jgi:MFS family permease
MTSSDSASHTRAAATSGELSGLAPILGYAVSNVNDAFCSCAACWSDDSRPSSPEAKSFQLIQSRVGSQSSRTNNESDGSILRNRNFVILWIAQFLTQTAQQAIWFGMIVVVEQVSQSSLHVSAAILSTIIPGVIFGLFAGVVVDRSNKKKVLIFANFLRAPVVFGYLLYSHSLYAVYAVNFAFVGISQFFGPAESATIPSFVGKRQLVAANSLFNLTFTVSQLVGIVFLAPWIIKFAGAPTLFIVIGIIYVIAGILTSFLPPGQRPERPLSSLKGRTIVRDIGAELAEAARFISRDRQTWWSMIFVTMSSTLMLILAMLAPRYVVVEVGIQPEDAVFMVAPAGLGILAMTLVLPRLARRFGELRLAYAGGIIMAIAVGTMAVLPKVLDQAISILPSTLVTSLALQGQHALVPPLMLVSAFIGIGVALTNIPAQSVLMDRAPIGSRGRIFAVLLMLGNVAAILPLTFLGVLADAYGLPAIAGVVGVAILAITLLAIQEGVANSPSLPYEPSIDEPGVGIR